MSETRTRMRLAILTLATCVALSTTGSSTVPARAAVHHARHCRPRAGEYVRRRFAHLIVLEDRRSKAIACVRATGHREIMIGGRYDDGIDFLLDVRRTAGTIIAYDVQLGDDAGQTLVLDVATEERVPLTSLRSLETSAVRVLLRRDGTLATTIGTYSGSGDPNPENVQVVICDVADCSPPSDHLATYGADIDPRSLRREDDQACWTRTVAMRAPQKECAPLSTD